MDTGRVIRKEIRHEGDGVQVAADVNAVISANVGENHKTTTMSSKQRIVQRSGRRKVTPKQR